MSNPSLEAKIWLNEMRTERLNRQMNPAPPTLPIYPMERPRQESVFEQLDREHRQKAAQTLINSINATMPVSSQPPASVLSVNSVPWQPAPPPKTGMRFAFQTLAKYPSEGKGPGGRFPGGPISSTGAGFEAHYTASEYLRFVKENKYPPWWGPIRGLADVEANLNSDLNYFQNTPRLPPVTRQIAAWNIATAVNWVREQRARSRPPGADPIPF